MKKTIITVLIGFVGGFLWLAGMRFFLAQPEEIHYHSNFAVYINGERELFELGTYYEEIQACTTAYENNPKGRTHMHDRVNDVIHVHDARVTYGNFFENIGWGIGKDYLITLEDKYIPDATHKLTYILNGEEIDSVRTKVIDNMDKLLITYGTESDEEIMKQYETVGDSAKEKNKYQDPSSCSGLNGAGHDSFGNKLKRATFWSE